MYCTGQPGGEAFIIRDIGRHKNRHKMTDAFMVPGPKRLQAINKTGDGVGVILRREMPVRGDALLNQIVPAGIILPFECRFKVTGVLNDIFKRGIENYKQIAHRIVGFMFLDFKKTLKES